MTLITHNAAAATTANTSTLQCPHCGAPAHLAHAQALSNQRGTLDFRCSRTSCASQFQGIFTLTSTPPTPGKSRAFSVFGPQRNAAPQLDGAQATAPKQFLTDC